MGEARTRQKPLPVKLFCGLIGSEASIEEAERLLEAELGPVDLRSPYISFDFTDYYAEEMGTGLKRRWIAFDELRERVYLAQAKHAAVIIEGALSADGRRTVNIDPGYVDDAQVVLSTAKNFSHRIYIGKGYYAEATLVHSGGGFKALEWTYPDYKSGHGLEFFEEARSMYHRQLRRGYAT
jgi:hypothetical protein